MKKLLAIAGHVDRLTNAIGAGVSWLAFVMVLVGAFNAVARYLGRFIGHNLSSNLYLEAQWYLFSILFLSAAGWALQQEAHVRVDVVFARLSPRARTWINVLGTTLLFVPFCVLVIGVSWPSVAASWQVLEQSPDPGGLPRYPLKTMIIVSFVLLLVQGLAELIKEVARLTGHLPFPPASSSTPEEKV
jgi:TRAP-type mannitol/chloroaromatic compound transport system permease small subunit